MKCACGSELRQFNFLSDEAEMHRHHSKAQLVGFSNPDGWRCTNARECTAVYGRAENGKVRRVEAKVRYDCREDLGKAGGIWEIVDEWSMK